MFCKENKKNQKKLNNKGFSLVELIVVIAIMAVLVAVLAPQFTKYVDRSRQSNDATTVSGIVTAAEVAVADLDYDTPEGTYEITVTETGTTITYNNTPVEADENGNPNMANAIVDSCGDLTELVCTANEWDTHTITITLTVANDGAIDVGYDQEFEEYVNQ